MICRPTTDEIIADCCRELTDAILPALTDQTLQVRLVMTETVLRNAAVRAAHEIAWMRAETAALTAYADAVDAQCGTDELRAARSALADAPSDSLHLADVAETYTRAEVAFTAALTAAQDAGEDALVTRARDLLHERIATEKQVMATYQVVGR